MDDKQYDCMKPIVRSGLGFISGFLMLWGSYSIQSNNEVVGVIGIVLGICLFRYSYRSK